MSAAGYPIDFPTQFVRRPEFARHGRRKPWPFLLAVVAHIVVFYAIQASPLRHAAVVPEEVHTLVARLVAEEPPPRNTTAPVVASQRPVSKPAAAPAAAPRVERSAPAPAVEPVMTVAASLVAVAQPPDVSGPVSPLPATAAPVAAPANDAPIARVASPSPMTRPMAAAPESAALTPPRFDAAYLNNPPPAYPPLARRMGDQGKVMLRVHVDTEGRADDVEVKAGSGSLRLDEAALATVKRWRFAPARQGDRAVAAWVLVPIVFRLES